MHKATLATEDDFEGWRDAARAFALADVPPDAIAWTIGETASDLFATAGNALPPPAIGNGGFSVPRPFLALAKDVICYRDPERLALLYIALLRLRDEPQLIGDHADPLFGRLETMAKTVRRDIHKMRAFLRFRALPEGEDGAERFVAWFEPEHHIVRTNARFFIDRFASMRWTILTPELTIDWDGETLHEGPGAQRSDAPDSDPLETLWKTYYSSIFNPARVKVGAMLKEMPRKYWKNMPETALVPGLIAGAAAREQAMVAASRDQISKAPTPRAPPGGNLQAAWEALRNEAAACTRCHLYKHATQTVFGAGPIDATMMFVGEQPGDQEDLQGLPFVGPAGQLFDEALEKAGIDRATTYVTNAVKHFKFEPRGKRRIHSKPDGPEIEACKWWIGQERELIQPKLTVALGATAARSMLGRVVTISGARDQWHRLSDGATGMVTVHPSYLLRIPDRDHAAKEHARFIDDLKRARDKVAELIG